MIDIDKLDNLPTHERLWEMYGYVERNYRTPLKVQQAYTIFYKSIGKNMSDIQKRIGDLLPADESFNTFVLGNTERVYYDDNGKLKLRNSLYTRYGGFSRGYRYVDEDNILRYVKPTFKREHLKSYYTEDTKKEKKKRDIERRAEGLGALKMINKPDLFRYYKGLKKEYKELTNALRMAEWKYKTDEAKILAFPKKYVSDIHRYNAAVKSKPRIEVLNTTISKLESGDYSVFYISSAYLYSIGKECHHV